MKNKYRFSPPGVSIESNAAILAAAAFIFIILISGIASGSAKEALWYRDDIRLMETLKSSFAGFWAYAAVCIAIVFRNYHSFRESSQSIYTMKRVSDPSDIHRMCLTVPIIGLLAGLALAIILMFIYRSSFIDEFPGKDPEFYHLDIWRSLTW